MILGIDEVGRGAWAGPLVVGAALLNGASIEGLTDSKVLTPKKRELLFDEIEKSNMVYGLGWVSAKEIDEIGLGAALRLATKRAVKEVQAQKVTFHEIIIDGTINFLSTTPLERYVTTIKKADLLIPSVSAASIVAKVSRDRWMATQDDVFTGYDFTAHVGYGTAKHQAALRELGPCEMHRQSFAPVAEVLGKKHITTQDIPSQGSTSKNEEDIVTTKSLGDAAETRVARWLEAEGHEIVERNWKTKFCEIDIISQKEDTIYFTEVKYRKNADHGDGLAAITIKKQRQMKFAAEVFSSRQRSNNFGLRLAVADVSGEPAMLQKWFAID